jgi:hypothetical protein
LGKHDYVLKAAGIAFFFLGLFRNRLPLYKTKTIEYGQKKILVVVATKFKPNYT